MRLTAFLIYLSVLPFAFCEDLPSTKPNDLSAKIATSAGRELTKFNGKVIDSHTQRFPQSSIPSSVEMVLKLVDRVPASYFDLQMDWKNKEDGNFKDFDGKTIKGVTFHLQFRLPRNNDFPLEKLFTAIHDELEAGRFVIVSLSSDGGWNYWVVYDEDPEGEFLAVSKAGPTTIQERHVKAAITRMKGTEIGTYEISPLDAIAADNEIECVQTITLPDIGNINCIAISHDGKFAYTASSSVDEVGIFQRDAETGKLTLSEQFKDPAVKGPTRVRISADDQYVLTADSKSATATIFKRDPGTGSLTKVASTPDPEAHVQDAILSPDNHFLYLSSHEELAAFKFENGALSQIQREKDLKKFRPFVISPDGHCLYAVSEGAGTLTVYHRDEATGEFAARQVVDNSQAAIAALSGVFRLALSNDGKYVYTSAGRNQGDQAVGAFAVQPDGQVKFVQQLLNGQDDFDGFEGGNEIAVSPDGKWVFATATTSDRLFRLSRDPATGKLACVGSQQVGLFQPPGTATICFSPDSKFAYVGDQGEHIVCVYKVQ